MAEKKKKAIDYHKPGKKPWIALGALSAVIIAMVVASVMVWKHAVPKPQVVDVEEIELRAMDMGGTSGGGATGPGQQPGAGNPSGGQPGAPPDGGGGNAPPSDSSGGAEGGTSTSPVTLKPGESIIGKLLGDEIMMLSLVSNYMKVDEPPSMDDPSMMMGNEPAATGPPSGAGGGPGGGPGGNPGGGPDGEGGGAADAGSRAQAYLKAKDGGKPKLFNGRITEKHPNGTKKWEVTVKEGYAHGLVLRWDDEGRVVAKMQYAEGMVVGLTSMIKYDVTRDEVFDALYGDFAVAHKDKPSNFVEAMKDIIKVEKGPLKTWIINDEIEESPKSLQLYYAGQLLWWADWDNTDGKWKRFKILLPWHYEEKMAEAAKGEEELPDDERPKEHVKVETPGIYSLNRKDYTALGEPKKEEEDANSSGPPPSDDPNAAPPPNGPGAGPPQP